MNKLITVMENYHLFSTAKHGFEIFVVVSPDRRAHTFFSEWKARQKMYEMILTRKEK